MIARAASPARSPLHRRAVRFALSLAVLAWGLMLVGCAHQRPGAERRVLVMDFENSLPGQPDSALADGLGNMLKANLANYPGLAVVERPDLRTSRTVNWHTLARKLDVDYVVVGSISKLDNNFILTARLLSVYTGDVVKGSAVTRSCKREADIFPIMQSIARVLAHHLQVLSERAESWESQFSQR